MSSTCNILPWLRTDRIDLAEPKLRMEPAEAIDKMLPADPTESMQPADPSDMIEPTENTDWIEPVEQNERMDLVENSDLADSYPAAASLSLDMPHPVSGCWGRTVLIAGMSQASWMRPPNTRHTTIASTSSAVPPKLTVLVA